MNESLTIAVPSLRCDFWLGEPELAIERFARGMRLNPLDPRGLGASRIGTAHALFFLGDYDEASSWAAMGLLTNPDAPGDCVSPLQAMRWRDGWSKRTTQWFDCDN